MRASCFGSQVAINADCTCSLGIQKDQDDDSEDELEEDAEALEDEEWEDENDYAENYFDNGEDDGGEGGDALGGGGDEGRLLARLASGLIADTSGRSADGGVFD